MKTKAEKQHAYLMIGCGKEHGAFHVEDGHFICDNCNKDFTDNVHEVVGFLQHHLYSKYLTQEEK